jgi:putative intracellular protease/amidase
MRPDVSTKHQALIVMSSARILPLSEPAGHPGIPTGFFLVELAQVLREFAGDYEFTFATPDGRAPQLDVNGLALPFHAGRDLGAVNTVVRAEQAGRFDVGRYRRRHADLVSRREAELRLAREHLGSIAVSATLPNSDKEVKLIADEVAASFSELPPRTYLSVPEVIRKDRDPADPFSLGDFDFVHMPGGHAPMVDFDDEPWMGELLNSLYEQGVLISLICHAPVAMTSARYRVARSGVTLVNDHHPFAGARLTTVPKHGENFVLSTSYPKVPGQRTRLTYYVDTALKATGYLVSTTLNPAAANIVWDESRRLLTGNGPQAVDVQTAKIREVIGRRQPPRGNASPIPVKGGRK